MPEVSSKRPLLKIAGIASAIIGIGLIVLGFTSETQTFITNIPGQPPEFSEIRGETNFQRYLMGGFGIILGYVGFRLFRYIPSSERERDHVSEEDLD